MRKFKMINTCKNTLAYCRDNWKVYGLNTIVMILMNAALFAIFIGVVIGNIITIQDLNSNGFIETLKFIVIAIMFYMPLLYIQLIIMGVFVKMTDDIYENRISNYKKQFMFVIKKSGRMILAGIVVYIPTALLQYSIMFFIATFDSEILMSLYLLVMMLISMMFAMTNHSILIEDSKVFSAIKRSVQVMFPNLLKIIGFWLLLVLLYVVSFLILGLIALLISKFPILIIISVVVLIIAVIVLGFLLIPFSMVFVTLLFKSVIHTPYDRDERLTEVESDESYDELFEDRIYE